MKFEDYLQLFSAPISEAEQQDPHSMGHFTKLNDARIHRWLNHGIILEDTKNTLSTIRAKQHWILITEAWCGDAAHIAPFIYLMSELTDKIQLDIQLRDSGSEIDQYLTNGSKSIPILIIRDELGKDLAVWGPRPKACQEVYQEMKDKGVEIDELKLQLQKWYNADKGVAVQKEISGIISSIQST